MEKFVADHGKETEKIFYFYTTCPGCAKFYRKNYVVAVAKIRHH